jgi:hypothetical protein
MNNYYYYYYHISVMELGHLLTRSGLTCPEASSKVCHDSFCQSGSSASLPWVYYCYYYYVFYYFLQITQCVNCKSGVSWLSRIKSIESTHRANK